MVFKDTNLKVLFKTKNTIGNLLKHNSININSHKQSDIYQLICPNCGKRYVGQSGILSYGLKNTFSHLNCVMINASSFSTLVLIHTASRAELNLTGPSPGRFLQTRNFYYPSHNQRGL